MEMTKWQLTASLIASDQISQLAHAVIAVTITAE
jgi:hypothetical protein